MHNQSTETAPSENERDSFEMREHRIEILSHLFCCHYSEEANGKVCVCMFNEEEMEMEAAPSRKWKEWRHKNF